MPLAANEYKLYFPKGNAARFSGGAINFELWRYSDVPATRSTTPIPSF
jgi:hypothetical protein